MLLTEKKVIDGLEVTVVQLPTMRAWSLFVNLGATLGPALGPLLQGESVAKMDVDVFFGALGSVFANLKNGGDQLLRECLVGTSVIKDGSVHQLDSEHAINAVLPGKLKTLIKIAWFSLQVNFKDFTDGFNVEAVLEAKDKATSSPSRLIRTSRKPGPRGVSG